MELKIKRGIFCIWHLYLPLKTAVERPRTTVSFCILQDNLVPTCN
jgi:hypothetical protein